MPRHVAFLRGVMPTNAKMPELKRAFERAGFTTVKTVLASGNVAFDTASRSEARIAQLCEAAMAEQDVRHRRDDAHLGHCETLRLRVSRPSLRSVRHNLSIGRPLDRHAGVG